MNVGEGRSGDDVMVRVWAVDVGCRAGKGARHAVAGLASLQQAELGAARCVLVGLGGGRDSLLFRATFPNCQSVLIVICLVITIKHRPLLRALRHSGI